VNIYNTCQPKTGDKVYYILCVAISDPLVIISQNNVTLNLHCLFFWDLHCSLSKRMTSSCTCFETTCPINGQKCQFDSFIQAQQCILIIRSDFKKGHRVRNQSSGVSEIQNGNFPRNFHHYREKSVFFFFLPFRRIKLDFRTSQVHVMCIHLLCIPFNIYIYANSLFTLIKSPKSLLIFSSFIQEMSLHFPSLIKCWMGIHALVAIRICKASILHVACFVS